MQLKFVKCDKGNRRLLLFFCGWSTDYHLLENYDFPEGYDVAAIWDYSTQEVEMLYDGYDETIIIAWSFGVAEATNFISKYKDIFNITGRFAINGSPIPIDETKGIKPEVFKSTIKNLDSKNLLKFKIRICGGKNNYNELSGALQSDMNVETLRKELEYFGERYKVVESKDDLAALWDYAFISVEDLIFPVENLRRVWQNTPLIEFKDSHHYFDFQKVIDLTIKHKNRIKNNFEQRQSTYNEEATVQREIVENLFDKWKHWQSDADCILEIGPGTGILTKKIIKGYHPQNFVLIDLMPFQFDEKVEMKVGDAEVLMPKFTNDYFDSIATSSTVQWFHSPRKFLSESKRILKTGGVLAFSVFTKGTCIELQQITGNSLLYLSGDDWEKIIETIGFKVLEREDSLTKLYFDRRINMFRHLRSSGVNSVTGKSKFSQSIKKYLSAPDEKCELTYNSSVFILRKE